MIFKWRQCCRNLKDAEKLSSVINLFAALLSWGPASFCPNMGASFGLPTNQVAWCFCLGPGKGLSQALDLSEGDNRLDVTRAKERQEGNDKKAAKTTAETWGQTGSGTERDSLRNAIKGERLRFSFSCCRWNVVIVEALEAARCGRALR